MAWLEFNLLSVALLTACAAPPAANAPATVPPGSQPTAAAPGAATATASPPPLPADSETKPNPVLSAPEPVATPEPEPAPLPKGTRVLQIGDSFAAALGVELGKLLKEAGVRTSLEYKTASYIPNWSYEGDVPRFVANYQPDLVLIHARRKRDRDPETRRTHQANQALGQHARRPALRVGRAAVVEAGHRPTQSDPGERRAVSLSRQQRAGS